MTPLLSEVGQTYLTIADLSEGTIDPLHAVDIAEWVVERRHPVRSRVQRVLYGYTLAWWSAQAIREHLARVAPA